VNSLVNRFEQAAKMMKTVAKGGTPNIPGMPMGMPTGPRPVSKKDKGKKKGSKSGNPAKRAAEAAGIQLDEGKKEGGSAFGLQ
jgi:signal recognition particle subunit SRP54